MQHKKYQRKYKFSLVFGPTLWGHHINLVDFFVFLEYIIIKILVLLKKYKLK